MTQRHLSLLRWAGLWLVLVLLPLALLAACGGKAAPPPPPGIATFQAAKSPITAGQSTTLTAVFSGGSGTVEPGLGPIQSGAPVSTGALSADRTYTLSVSGLGGTATQSVQVRVVAAPATPVITVPQSITADTQGTASVPEQAGCTYAWSLSGGTFVGPDNTPTITFRAGPTGHVQLYCVAINAAGTESRPGLALCTISAVPLAPAISAPAHVTAGQPGYTASVPATLSYAIQWSIQGGTLTSGDRGPSVTFTPGASGTVELFCTLSNAAGTTSAPGTARCAIVAPPVEPIVSAPPFVISGSQGNRATTSPQPGCTFQWSVSGATVTAGGSTHDLRFTAANSGDVTLACVAVNAAGTASRPGTAFSTIVTTPQAPVITAPAQVTAGQAGYLASVPTLEGYRYAWSITGGTLTAGATTPKVTFTAGASGTLTLSCVWTTAQGFTASPGTATCTIVQIPAAPTIYAPMLVSTGDLTYAYVTPQAGCTYDWTIRGGRFVGPTTGDEVQFRVGASGPLRLTCRVVNASGVAGDPGVAERSYTVTHAQAIAALGLGNPPPRRGAQGQELSEDDHPYGHGSQPVNVHPILEVLTVHTNRTAVASEVLTPGYNLSALTVPQLATGNAVVPILADTDGDGRSEVIYLTLPNDVGGGAMSSFGLHRLSGGTLTTLGTVNTSSFEFAGWAESNEYSWGVPWAEHVNARGCMQLYHQLDVAAGDLDGDGTDELAVILKDTLHLVKVTGGSPTLLRTEVLGSGNARHRILRVECADLDGDGRAELLVTNGQRRDASDRNVINQVATLAVYAWNGSTLVSRLAPTDLAVVNAKLRTAEVKVEDLDADGRLEVVVAGLSSGFKGSIYTAVFRIPTSPTWSLQAIPSAIQADDLNSTLWEWWGGDLNHDWMVDRDNDAAIPPLALGDLDGDGQLEIISGNSILSFKDGSPLGYAFSASSKNRLAGEEYWCFTTGVWTGGSPWRARRGDTGWFTQVAVGRISREPGAQEEILILDRRRNLLRRYAFDANTRQIIQGQNLAIQDATRALLLADLNDDGTEATYVGHRLVFGRPVILAALASPPFWSDKTQDGEDIQAKDSSLTSFGATSGVGGSVGAKAGFNISGKFGAKAIVPVVANGEAKATFSAGISADFRADLSTDFTLTLQYDSYAGQDSVLFAGVPIDYYVYRITKAAPGSGYTVGDVVAIQRERPAVLQFTPVQYYNDNNGDYPDIDSSIFRHTIGKPFSYPTRSEVAVKQALDPTQWFMMANPSFGIVPGDKRLYNSMSYNTSVAVGSSAEFAVTGSYDVEASFAGLAGYSAGGYVGVTISSKITLGTTITGSVGGLLPEYYTPDYTYTWGIASYLDAIGNGTYPLASLGKDGKPVFNFPFKVITYWVNRM